MRSKEWKVIRDAVHGEIELHPLCVAIVDTIEFQRLRNISQCGLTHLVYPSARHSRFEHSLGVYHLAGVMLNTLTNSGISIGEEDKLCVQIAALCHDLGHGPFSHTWERFLNLAGERFVHEKYSVKLFDYLIEKNKLSKKFDVYGIDKEKIDFIKNLILGKPIDPKKGHLFEIVANNETGVDVDKWDYMLRDAFHFGIKTELNYERILSSTTVFNDNGHQHIAFRDKVAPNIMEMFNLREKLHRISYQHHASKVIEVMLIDALLCADEFYRVKLSNVKEVKLSKCHDDLEAFIKLSDSLYYELFNSVDENLKAGRDIIERIMKRDLYVHVIYPALKVASNESEHDSLRLRLNMFKSSVKGKIKESFSDIDVNKLRVIIIDVSTSPDKLEKIVCFNRNNEKVKFPRKMIESEKAAVLVYSGKMSPESLQRMKDMFFQLCSSYIFITK